MMYLQKVSAKNFLKKGMAPLEFLLSGGEIKSTGKIKEWTVPVLTTASAFNAMMTNYLFWSYCIWEQKVPGRKICRPFEFFEHFL
jgi:hypothetical protein